MPGKVSLKQMTDAAAQNASKSLSKLTGERVSVEVSKAAIAKVTRVFPGIEAESRVVGIYLPVTGKIKGASLLIFPEKIAYTLCDVLVRREVGMTHQFTMLDESALKEVGNIITYTGFETMIINGLIKLFPDLEKSLNCLLDRVVDLHKIIRENYYDPVFYGSTSIKRVLPVVVPELSYDGMNIADGGDAMAVFAYMVKGKYEDGEIEQTRKDLLEYCKLDTLAMVRLHEKLVKMHS